LRFITQRLGQQSKWRNRSQICPLCRISLLARILPRWPQREAVAPKQTSARGCIWPLRARRLRLVVPEASSSLCKQLGVPRRERLRQLLFKPPAKVPQRPRFSLVRYGESVRIGEATDELEEHKGLIGTQLKVNGLPRLLIHARRIVDVPESRPSPTTAAGRWRPTGSQAPHTSNRAIRPNSTVAIVQRSAHIWEVQAKLPAVRSFSSFDLR
jgi:hypothetical protein